MSIFCVLFHFVIICVSRNKFSTMGATITASGDETILTLTPQVPPEFSSEKVEKDTDR